MCTKHERVYGGCSKSDHRLVSLTGAHLVPGDKVEIGYWVGAEFHGARYGFEAANEMLLENHMSSHLLKNLGFKETGINGARL